MAKWSSCFLISATILILMAVGLSFTIQGSGDQSFVDYASSEVATVALLVIRGIASHSWTLLHLSFCLTKKGALGSTRAMRAP
ncbi:hypothetical protein NC653_018454 [Populus alba x Populus x berolinensis]|uniref:Uncharacterized protein n=1 Tax=Populus alba x Populus x berolinensis TaxID=444605 RepID=A0AAD6QGG8_9ROSI|nr:hypothetical protein NC653_018454 [Populus alba x Populus x berolinensis]